MTKRECAIIETFTGVCMCAGDDRRFAYRYAEEKLGHPIFTHEFPLYAEALKEAAREDFFKLCASSVDDGTL